MYADMAKVARDEGFSEIAEQMEGVAAIEKYHEERYLKFRETLLRGGYLPETRSMYGFVPTADITTGELRLPIYVPYAFTTEDILKFRRIIYSFMLTRALLNGRL